jgi:hypothetical protein
MIRTHIFIYIRVYIHRWLVLQILFYTAKKPRIEGFCQNNMLTLLSVCIKIPKKHRSIDFPSINWVVHARTVARTTRNNFKDQKNKKIKKPRWRQGDQMSLENNCPKCVTTHFFVKISWQHFPRKKITRKFGLLLY